MPVNPQKTEVYFTQAIDHTSYWFTGNISHFGCLENSHKNFVDHSPPACILQTFLLFSQGAVYHLNQGVKEQYRDQEIKSGRQQICKPIFSYINPEWIIYPVNQREEQYDTFQFVPAFFKFTTNTKQSLFDQSEHAYLINYFVDM